MKLKSMAIATGALLGVAVVGLIISNLMSGTGKRGREGTSLIEGVDISKIAAIRIEDDNKQVNLTLTGEGWQVQEKAGFPASEEKIRKLVFNLGDQTIELKVTERKEKLRDLGVLAVDENNGKFEDDRTGARVTLLDQSGNPLLGLIVGNDRLTSNTQRGVHGGGGQYIRFVGEPAVYLIPKALTVHNLPREWLNTALLNVDHGKLFKSIRISRSGNKDLLLTKADEKAEWKMDGVKDELVNMELVKDLVNRIGELSIHDLAESGKKEADLGMARTGTVTIRLTDGRLFKLKVGEKKTGDDFRHIMLSATLEENTGDAELKKSVDRFNQRFGKRIIAIYDWEGEQILKSEKDLLKGKK